jgi:hypothetical protein
MEVVATQSDRWPFSVFRCTESGCTRQFIERQGYHDATSKQMDITTQRLKHCPAHAGAVAITSIQDSTLFWNCLHPDCEAYEPTFEAVS